MNHSISKVSGEGAAERQAGGGVPEATLLAQLEETAALLAGDGTIVAVNAAWRAFGRRHGHASAPEVVGTSYLRVCEQAALSGDRHAATVLVGMLEVMAGRCLIFETDYPCEVASEKLWFRFVITSAPGARFLVRHIDITSVQRAEAERRAASLEAERYRELFQRANTLVAVLDLEGCLVHVNPPWSTMLLSTPELSSAPERLLGRRLGDFVHADDLGPLTRAFAALHDRERASVQHDFRVRAGDGTYRWIEGHATADPERGLVFFIGVDKTERERQSRLLADIQRSVHIGGWELDPATQRLYWDEQTYAIHALSPSDYVPERATAMDFYAPHHRPVVAAGVEHALATGEPFDLELQLDTARGQRIWVQAIGKAVCEEGHVAKLHGSIQDITHRKQTELALRHSQAQLEAAERRAGLGSWSWSVAARAFTFSTAMYQLCDRSPALGPPSIDEYVELFHPGDRDQVRAMHTEVLRDGEARCADLRTDPARGPRRHVHVCVFRESSTDEGVLSGVVQDISERKRAERDLQEAQQQRLALWERLAGAQEEERRRIARELHDQAGSALAYLLVSCKRIEHAPSLPEARDRTRTLAGNIERVLDEVARIARGLHPVALDELGLVPALARTAQAIAELAHLKLELHLDVGENRLASDVEQALFRIAQEALTNAARHAQARRVVVRLRHEASDLVMTVQDDGRGFDTRTIFEPIREGQLGLASIRDRAALLGGRMDVDSVPGVGTTLRVCLPAGIAGSALA